jgi:hypothetical protein
MTYQSQIFGLILCTLLASACVFDGQVDYAPREGTGGSAGAGGSTNSALNEIGGRSSGGATSASDCECPLYESAPSVSAKYIGPCGEFDMYAEPAIGIPNELFVCIERADASI